MSNSTFRLTPHHGERGFTLVELMITIVILAIITAAALPSFRSMITNQRIKSASFDIMAMLTFARSEAIKRNAEVTLNLDPVLRIFTVTTVGVGTPLKQQDMSSGLQIDCVNMAVTPHTYNGGATCNIPLTYNGNGRLKFAVGPFELHPTINTLSDTTAIFSRCITLDMSGRPNSKKGAC